MVEGQHYPRTWPEFERRFATEEACRDYLVDIRWPTGFHCPSCGGGEWGPTGRAGLRQCSSCRRQTTVTVGTLFERTKMPLQVWFRAMWLITSQKNGVSALGLQRQLGLERYETVWTMLHKLRRAMVRPGREKLRGTVEVDETYVGGEEKGVRGRETLQKSLVVIAAEENGQGIGRIRLEAVPDASGANLVGFVADCVEPRSVVHTDGWEGYINLSARGFRHQVSNISASGQRAHQLLPRVHRVASLLERWLLGTHQGAVRPLHLDYYLDEFTFRFNRRTSATRGQLFYRLVQQAAQVPPVTWAAVADAERGGTPNHNR